MKKFDLIPKDNQFDEYVEGKTDDMMYEIVGDTELIKRIIHDNIKQETSDYKLCVDEMETLNIFVTYNFDNECVTEIWLDYNEYKDLYLIAQVENLKLNEVDTIKEIVIGWLIGKEV